MIEDWMNRDFDCAAAATKRDFGASPLVVVETYGTVARYHFT